MAGLPLYRKARDRFLGSVNPPAAPAITLVEVSKLFRDDLLIEIEAVGRGNASCPGRNAARSGALLNRDLDRLAPIPGPPDRRRSARCAWSGERRVERVLRLPPLTPTLSPQAGRGRPALAATVNQQRDICGRHSAGATAASACPLRLSASATKPETFISSTNFFR